MSNYLVMYFSEQSVRACVVWCSVRYVCLCHVTWCDAVFVMCVCIMWPVCVMWPVPHQNYFCYQKQKQQLTLFSIILRIQRWELLTFKKLNQNKSRKSQNKDKRKSELFWCKIRNIDNNFYFHLVRRAISLTIEICYFNLLALVAEDLILFNCDVVLQCHFIANRSSNTTITGSCCIR